MIICELTTFRHARLSKIVQKQFRYIYNTIAILWANMESWPEKPADRASKWVRNWPVQIRPKRASLNSSNRITKTGAHLNTIHNLITSQKIHPIKLILPASSSQAPGHEANKSDPSHTQVESITNPQREPSPPATKTRQPPNSIRNGEDLAQSHSLLDNEQKHRRTHKMK